MNSEIIDKIANAILYEGYILYPYRRSAIKNQHRWNFGVLYPRAYAEAQTGHDAWRMQTECLVANAVDAELDLRVRFLQTVNREIGKLESGADFNLLNSEDFTAANVDYSLVDSLEVAGRTLQSWQEAIEREVLVSCGMISDLAANPRTVEFSFPGSRQFESMPGDGRPAAVIIRTNETVDGEVKVYAERKTESLFKISAVITNRSAFAPGDGGREAALISSMLSAHVVLSLRNGEFVSLLDPPDEFRSAVATCSNAGCWPVLVGENGERDTMLASPIILYDYPNVAAESPGNLFDGTEIDEILSLRILTLTDEEKREAEGTDERTRRILERTEALPREQFMKMHGMMRR